ncbi:MAG: hydroxysqualene dehydroxylase HpnE [Armatimonadetes bacterium]|nr:hydroxysqualene dehydroxylase HpnE [Armatimonadota bacterium]MDE2207657.1 hydroxysqualene dehydroxylase HpnE [Armatimonadota bacterium]
MACAVALSQLGYQVTLIEKRPMLGGRASSFIDAETGEVMDVCQHGTMRCCTNLQWLLAALGVEDQIRWLSALEFADSSGHRFPLRAGILPAPLHMAASFARFGALQLADKLAIARGMLRILRTGEEADRDDRSMEAWLRETRQTPRAVSRFWQPVLVSACNDSPACISQAVGLKVFRYGFLRNRSGWQFGLPGVPLGTLFTGPAERVVAAAGGVVRLRTHIAQFEIDRSSDGAAITGYQLQSGETVRASHYISALPFDALARMAPEALGPGGLEFAPIAGVHLWFEGRIEAPHALALLDCDADWVFNKTANFAMAENGETWLHVVKSSAGEWCASEREAVRDRALEGLYGALPRAREHRLLRWKVLKERKATFRPGPGVAALRPGPESSLNGLVLAGEWTNTGWPSTMESAARSGLRAAEAIAARDGMPTALVQPDLSPSTLVRWLSAC